MDFMNALQFVFAKEGGFSNDPTDRGGATNFGISSKANPDVDVKTLTKDKAADLYKSRYWDPIGADHLPADMKLAAFDTAVQHGVGAAKQLIEASGGDTQKLLSDRATLYKTIVANDPSQAKYTNGWNNRLNAVSAASAPQPTAQPTAQPTPASTNVEQSVAQWSGQKLGDNFILSKLADAGHGPEIEFATQQGYSPAEIVSKFGGQSLASNRAAQAKVDAQGFGTNLIEGVKGAGQDLATGAQQIGATLTGNDARLAELNAQEAQRQADPTYQAQGNTAGSKIGNFGVKALPYAAAALVPELGVPAMIATQGAVGAGMGALKPTTGDGQRFGNIATEGGLAAAGGAGGALIGKGSTALAGKLLGGGTAEDAALVARRAADAQAQGLPVNASTLSGPNGFWRNVAESLPENGSVKAFSAKADAAVASKVADGLGLSGYAGPIDTELLNAARPGIKTALDNATNVSVTLPQTLKADLQGLLGASKNPLTEGIATDSVVSRAAANLTRAVDSGAAVSGRQLQDLASELKAVTQNSTASASERQIAGQMVGKVNDALTSGMSPEQAAAFNAANRQYASLKAVEKMVSASGDTGVVTPRQMINAVKTGRFKNAFFQGDAPFQELAGTAADLYGPAGGKGLGSALAKAAGGHNEGFEAGALLNPSVGIPALLAKKAGSALLGKLASSENPTLVRLLSGQKSLDPTTAAFIAKALGNAGATSTAQ